MLSPVDGKKLMVMAGGTGGHVFPGLAVAKSLQQKGWSIHWLGTAQRMEANIVPKAGFSISFIDVAGVRGNGLLRLLAAPLHIIRAIFQSVRVIREFQPDLVLGLGGFASGPGGVAAWLMRVPLLLHEQNAVPGFTNKLLARLAKRVLTGFDKTFEAQQQNDSSGKYQWVGNPVREEFYKLSDKENITLPLNILVVGGSLGAKALNDYVPIALSNFEQFTVRHQCGAGHLPAVMKQYQQYFSGQDNWQVDEFVEDMAAAYEWADLVICRAGALTVAEVSAAGVAAIFVPLPHAVDDHQTKNARTLTNHGGALLLPQHALEAGELNTLLTNIFAQPQQVGEMARQAKKMAKLDALEQVTAVCNELVEHQS